MGAQTFSSLRDSVQTLQVVYTNKHSNVPPYWGTILRIFSQVTKESINGCMKTSPGRKVALAQQLSQTFTYFPREILKDTKDGLQLILT